MNIKKIAIGLIVIMSAGGCYLSAFGTSKIKSLGIDEVKKQKISITKVYDFACPWCYVGKKRLDLAMKQRPDIEFSVTWRPFQLNPNMPREGLNRWEYYNKKFGEERASNILKRHKTLGAAEDIAFCDQPNAMAPNTLSAHVLMYWGGQDETVDTNLLAEKLYSAHHEACENIGDHQVLVRIAGEVGMDQVIVANKLTDGEDESLIKQLIGESKSQGITGVPYFMINDQISLSGAQPVDGFLNAFDQIIQGE
jgi:predicted DsbA family dithiol-disulfide isomerase